MGKFKKQNLPILPLRVFAARLLVDSGQRPAASWNAFGREIIKAGRMPAGPMSPRWGFLFEGKGSGGFALLHHRLLYFVPFGTGGIFLVFENIERCSSKCLRDTTDLVRFKDAFAVET
jgi:hypothetical protein